MARSLNALSLQVPLKGVALAGFSPQMHSSPVAQHFDSLESELELQAWLKNNAEIPMTIALGHFMHVA